MFMLLHIEEVVKVENKKYFIGLDIGTDSVGCAVTDTDYNILRKKKNLLWGVSLFDGAEQAAKRRGFRVARRAGNRKKQRVNLLQGLMAKSIIKVDPNFYIRLKESALYRDDKSIDTRHSLFDDAVFDDAIYGRAEYGHTIHHLIKALMENNAPRDPRLVYLACAYILSHRGHFLIEVDKDNITEVKNFDYVYNNFLNWFDCADIERPFEANEKLFAKVLKDNKGITGREKAFKELLWGGKKPDDSEYPLNRLALIKLISGGKVDLSAIFKNDSYKELENNKIILGVEDFDSIYAQLASELEDGEADLILMAKGIYDWALLADILGNADTISEAKVNVYDKHGKDLQLLKNVVNRYIPEKYNEVFRLANNKVNNYTKYTGNIKSSEIVKSVKFEKCDQEGFCKYIKSLLGKVNADLDDEEYMYIKNEVESNSLCPKQVNTDNRVIPYQLYYYELKKILDNACTYIDELNDTDEYGSVKDKILSLMTFRIPYYVGPLVSSSKSGNAWMVRKAEGKIYPWNFNEMVDKDKSEDAFIRRMTCKCTYIAGEDVLPKNSLLYSKFKVLNEINNITVNGSAIPVEIKQGIYNNLFMRKRTVSRKDIENYLIMEGIIPEDNKVEYELKGIDIKVNSSLKSYIDFKEYLDNGILTQEQVERIIERITITTDKKRLKGFLKDEFGLSSDAVTRIAKFRYKDFGRLSAMFLTGIRDIDVETAEICGPNIISMLWETNNNLMELLSQKYHYSEYIEFLNSTYYQAHPKTIDERLNDMYISGSVRRPILRTLDVVREIVNVMGYPPEKIFVEMARDFGGDKKEGRKISRRDRINALYDTLDDKEVKKLREELSSMGDEQLRGEKLYLYFIQLGRCMYSGKPIPIEQLATKAFDIDHIFPQAKVKDDSLDNKVLVYSELNGSKRDTYPINKNIRDNMYGLWTAYHKKGLITDKKFDRLKRSTPFTDDELAGFISRQLVETRQSTKAVATLLKEIIPQTELVYVKAGLVSQFRHDFEFLKCREVNDFHHAKDAYLNIVMGNVYNVKFTKNPLNFIKQEFRNNKKYSLKLTSLLDYDIERNGVVAWRKDGVSLLVVRKNMSRNSIRYVRYAYRRKGALYNLMPEKAAKGLINRKKNLPSEKYGGYNNTKATCFVLTKYYTNKTTGVVIMPLELMYAERFVKDEAFANDYIVNTLTGILNFKPDEIIEKVELPLNKRIIKINTVLEIDGFRVNIAQKSNMGKTLVLAIGTSFIPDDAHYEYIRRLSSYMNKVNLGKRDGVDTEFDKISFEDNLDLYDYIMAKINTSPYTVMFKKVAVKLENGKNRFLLLSLDEQVKVLLSMVSILKSGRSVGCDLRLIGDVEKAAILTLNSNLSKLKGYKSIRIVDQSPAGLYERYSDNLLEL